MEVEGLDVVYTSGVGETPLPALYPGVLVRNNYGRRVVVFGGGPQGQYLGGGRVLFTRPAAAAAAAGAGEAEGDWEPLSFVSHYARLNNASSPFDAGTWDYMMGKFNERQAIYARPIGYTDK